MYRAISEQATEEPRTVFLNCRRDCAWRVLDIGLSTSRRARADFLPEPGNACCNSKRARGRGKSVRYFFPRAPRYLAGDPLRPSQLEAIGTSRDEVKNDQENSVITSIGVARVAGHPLVAVAQPIRRPVHAGRNLHLDETARQL